MEACIVICRVVKPKARKGKILFINAVGEVTRERAQSFLTDGHIERIVRVYERFRDEPGLARVVPVEEIRAREGNLSIPLYVAPPVLVDSSSSEEGDTALSTALAGWLESSGQVRRSLSALLANGPSPKHR